MNRLLFLVAKHTHNGKEYAPQRLSGVSLGLSREQRRYKVAMLTSAPSTIMVTQPILGESAQQSHQMLVMNRNTCRT